MPGGKWGLASELKIKNLAGLFHACAIDSGAFNQWTYRPWEDAVDIWDNVTTAMGCNAWARSASLLLPSFFSFDFPQLPNTRSSVPRALGAHKHGC